MSEAPKTYHAVWWVPDCKRRFNGSKHTGTLKYNGDENSTLEVYHEPSQGTVFRAYEHYDVVWGESAGGQLFSLFNLVFSSQQDYTKTSFNVNFILIGAHVLTLEEPCFDTCVSRFEFLKDWAFSQRITQSSTQDAEDFHLDMSQREPLTSVEIEEGITTYLWSELSYHVTRDSLAAEQNTNYDIEIKEKGSIRDYLSIISEFTEFLSIALFAPQHPYEIRLKNKGEYQSCQLLYKQHRSYNPRHVTLIKYDKLKDRIPSMLFEWHSNHEQVAPIVSYLVRSIRYDNPFDTPDFLIIAQALDGYFKRFLNKKDGKDTHKYKDGIDKLLTRYKDVDVIKQIKLDSTVLEQSRNKYSHLIPDDDKKHQNAATGTDLFWLTQKCKILLTCCILDMLGLSVGEINLCCNQSPLGYIINAFPIEP